MVQLVKIKMKELYFEIFSDIGEDGACLAPLETVICLFTFIYCDNPAIQLLYVKSSNHGERASFKIQIPELMLKMISKKKVDGIGNFCKLPIIVTCSGTAAVAGLCAVLRQMIKTKNQVHSILGFKQSCLYACAESSPWTKFCEIDIVETVNVLYKKNLKSDRVEIPEDVARFESHMSQPVRIHNIQKQKQDIAKAIGVKRRSKLPDSRLDVVQELEHTYSEGPNITLADIMLFPSFHIIFENLGSVFLKQHLPLSWQWYETMLKEKEINQALKLFVEIQKKFNKEIYVNYILPQVSNQSFYKGDLKKRRPKRSFYTKQEDILECFEIVEQMETTIEMKPFTFGHEIDFDWTSGPSDFRLDSNQVPVKRLERKSLQLQNMTKAVLKIARNGDLIVDFCSGSGHLGLILAHVLPQCFIILLENKEQSLNRARERASKLKLSNIIFCQSNIDYFNGPFDIGVSLHACGVATDLVMERCIQEQAKFVCCPCCYGSIQSNHMISYPRSEVFKNSALPLKKYFILAHASDQTHYDDNTKTSQGNRCMTIIDSDRCLRAEEAGYIVTLSKLDPPSCTPKNNLLVGIPTKGRRL